MVWVYNRAGAFVGSWGPGTLGQSIHIEIASGENFVLRLLLLGKSLGYSYFYLSKTTDPRKGSCARMPSARCW
jgi:hypothetical protein